MRVVPCALAQSSGEVRRSCASRRDKAMPDRSAGAHQRACTRRDCPGACHDSAPTWKGSPKARWKAGTPMGTRELASQEPTHQGALWLPICHHAFCSGRRVQVRGE